mmetsp:Transcript_91187/g.260909  ORF Transcript_91187/g.260909 Transcript_91187/m.260909 type:complete len:222 (-) Transcript_91187:197-862(-)
MCRRSMCHRQRPSQRRRRRPTCRRHSPSQRRRRHHRDRHPMCRRQSPLQSRGRRRPSIAAPTTYTGFWVGPQPRKFGAASTSRRAALWVSSLRRFLHRLLPRLLLLRCRHRHPRQRLHRQQRLRRQPSPSTTIAQIISRIGARHGRCPRKLGVVCMEVAGAALRATPRLLHCSIACLGWRTGSMRGRPRRKIGAVCTGAMGAKHQAECLPRCLVRSSCRAR